MTDSDLHTDLTVQLAQESRRTNIYFSIKSDKDATTPRESSDVNPNITASASKCDMYNCVRNVFGRTALSDMPSIADKWEDIQIDISYLSDTKINQLKRIRKLIRISHAYSVYYYWMAGRWKRFYWGSLAIAVTLSAFGAGLNIIYDRCSTDSGIQQINVIVNTIITCIIGVIGAVNSALITKEHEDAGDDYKNFSHELYREVFFPNESISSLDLASIIYRYGARFDAYTKTFKEPNSTNIQRIMSSPDYDVSINFVTY